MNLDNNNVFFDFGNTKIKWAVQHKNKFEIISCLHNDVEKATNWIKTSHQHNPISKITIATSTKHKTLATIVKTIKSNKINYDLVSIDTNLLSINYKKTEQFGIDRYLNLIASKKIFNNNFCIISAGTAITIDFYTDQHIGGIIVPGISSSLDILQEKTKLNQIIKPNSLLGNDTKSSIGAGIYNGANYLVNGFIKSVSEKYKNKFSIIITGGDSAHLTEVSNNVNEQLLFQGITEYNVYINGNRKGN